MTIQQTTRPGASVNPADDRVQAHADDPCGAPGCGQPIGGHSAVNMPGVPEGPVHVDGITVGNARCAYELRLSLDGNLCDSCGGDNRRCSHTGSAHGWTTRMRRTVVFPAPTGSGS
ncbi:hypothetical protein ACIBTV_26630 [Micromonospora sp. NPDC049366]|uniref:hypothetical protein n=1 Tax=Micromonospora sp. NPDC049366 TaxID=3364271 RepID=UPI00378CF0F8